MTENDKHRYWAIAEWVMDNPEEGLKQFPEVVKNLETAIEKVTPHQEVQIINNIIDMFTKWAKELPLLLPKARKKKLEQYIDIVWMTMYMKYEDEIVIQEIKKQMPYLEEELSYLQAEYSKLSKKTSYEWIANPDKELPAIYNNLKVNELICPKTTQEQFINAFSKREATTIKPIQWIGKKNLLAYFIDSLFENNKISSTSRIWATAIICFTDAKNLAQLKENYRGNKQGKPKEFSIIDRLF
ncbi:MAG: hypothetical protein COA49_07320 [Bacteroidetes bacterium]|nr:MAG: hypothetical protein COA49_07320 [Bacteroidota bacterium]